MKKTTLFALAVIVCLVGAAVSSYCMATFSSSVAVFGIMAVLFAVGFTVFINKLTNAAE